MNDNASINKPISREKFLKDIETFCAKERVPTSGLGRTLFNDTAFYSKILKGRSPTLERVEAFYDYVANYGQMDLFS